MSVFFQHQKLQCPKGFGQWSLNLYLPMCRSRQPLEADGTGAASQPRSLSLSTLQAPCEATIIAA
jgi:hypothetical protein